MKEIKCRAQRRRARRSAPMIRRFSCSGQPLNAREMSCGPSKRALNRREFHRSPHQPCMPKQPEIQMGGCTYSMGGSAPTMQCRRRRLWVPGKWTGRANSQVNTKRITTMFEAIDSSRHACAALAQPLDEMEDTSANSRTASALRGRPKSALPPLLGHAGLEIYVGPYSVQVRNNPDFSFSFEHYGGELLRSNDCWQTRTTQTRWLRGRQARLSGSDCGWDSA